MAQQFAPVWYQSIARLYLPVVRSRERCPELRVRPGVCLKDSYESHAPMTDPTSSPLLAHGAGQLSRVHVDAYNAELRSAEGFVGDRASKRAFLAQWGVLTIGTGLGNARCTNREAGDQDPDKK
jgi:hypothetical protein